MSNKKHEREEEDEKSPPFSSLYANDYFDEIERRIEEQKKKKGRATKEWKADINVLIDAVNKMKKMKVYGRVT